MFVSINVLFHLFETWTPILLYIAIVNGGILGLIAGYLANKMSETTEVATRFRYAGAILGLFLSLLWIHNEIAVEFFRNQRNLPPNVDYLRSYLIGLGLGIVKSIYYAVVPSVMLLTATGFLAERILLLCKRRGHSGRRV